MNECQKCNGKGLIPFVKNGGVIPHTYVYCECRKEEPETYHSVNHEDFDYPMSYSYYRSLCQYNGWTTPAPALPVRETTQVESLVNRINDLEAISAEPGGIPEYYHEQVEHLRAQVSYLQNKLDGHLDKVSKTKNKGSETNPGKPKYRDMV